MNLYFDKWNRNKDEGGEIVIDKSSLNKAISYLENLNQKEFTQILVSTAENSLMIGGGNNSFVCVFTIGDNERFINLINTASKNEKEEIEVVAGGRLVYLKNVL